MSRRIVLVVLVMVVALGLAGIGPGRAAAATGPMFTVSPKSAFLRARPAFEAERSFSVFQGQRYGIVGRTAGSDWLLLDFAGAAGQNSWIAVSYGVVDGNLETVPVINPGDLPAPLPTAPSSGVTSRSGPSASRGLVRFTVTVSSLFARGGPDVQSARIVSLYKGQTYTATARNSDSNWVRLALAGGGVGWVPAAFGTFQGSPAGLPVAGATPVATAAPAEVAGSVLPTVSAAARAIYQRGLALGNNPRTFSKIGDCNSVAPFFLAPFDKGEYALGNTYAYLQATIDNFAGSFDRDGAAAHDGLNTASIFDPTWADPALCQANESPVACELRVQRPSLAIVSLGTNGGWQTNAEYEGNMRRLLDLMISRGVLPILSTKIDNLEGGDRFNQIVIQLALEYQLPLWDFATAGRALPGSGLADTYHPSWGRAYYDAATPPLRGWQVRNLTGLQALDAVWRAER